MIALHASAYWPGNIMWVKVATARLEQILVVDEDPSVHGGLDVSFSDLGDEGDYGALLLAPTFAVSFLMIGCVFVTDVVFVVVFCVRLSRFSFLLRLCNFYGFLFPRSLLVSGRSGARGSSRRRHVGR